MKWLDVRRWGVKILFAPLLIFILIAGVAAQQAVPPPKPNPPASGGSAAQTPPEAKADFMQAADEVLGQMSEILSLPVKEPLKKSLRSKQEIRDYLIREEKEDKVTLSVMRTTNLSRRLASFRRVSLSIPSCSTSSPIRSPVCTTRKERSFTSPTGFPPTSSAR